MINNNEQQLNEKKGKKKSRWLVRSVALFVALSIIAGAVYLVRLNSPEDVFSEDLRATLSPSFTVRETPELRTTPDQPSATIAPTPSPSPEPYRFEQNILNVLLLGLDGSTERYEKNYKPKTDTLMVLAINFDENKVDIISIPRDSYARIPVPESRQKAFKGQAGIKTRINEAFWAGGSLEGQGFENTKDAVGTLLGGIPIHYYVAVDMNVVKNIIDIMGGLYYDVEVDIEICGRTVAKGYQKLTGQQVLDYARVRKGYGDDFARMDRQQRIILAVVEQLKKANNILKIPEYYNAVSEKTYTDLNTEQIAALALFLNKLDLENDMKRHTLETVNLPLIDKKSMLGVKCRALKTLIEDIYGVTINIDWEMDGETIRNNR